MEEEKRVFKNGDREIEVSKEDLIYIFKGMRPRLMDYEDFKFVRKVLNKELKRYLKGRMIHLSKVSDSSWEEYIKEAEYKPIQKGRTYVKKG